jgi:hypothetical protein
MYDVWWCGSCICFLENKVTMCTIYYVYSKPVVVVHFYRTVNLWYTFGHKGIVNTHFFQFFRFFRFSSTPPSLKECISYMYDVWWCGSRICYLENKVTMCTIYYVYSKPVVVVHFYHTVNLWYTHSVTKESSILIFFFFFSIFSIFFNTTFFERMYMYDVWCMMCGVWWCGSYICYFDATQSAVNLWYIIFGHKGIVNTHFFFQFFRFCRFSSTPPSLKECIAICMMCGGVVRAYAIWKKQSDNVYYLLCIFQTSSSSVLLPPHCQSLIHIRSQRNKGIVNTHFFQFFWFFRFSSTPPTFFERNV